MNCAGTVRLQTGAIRPITDGSHDERTLSEKDKKNSLSGKILNGLKARRGIEEIYYFLIRTQEYTGVKLNKS